jgi:hypothetical protein
MITNFGKKILLLLLGQNVVGHIPVYLLRLLSWLIVCMLILSCFIFIVLIDYIIHPSAILAPIRWRVRDVALKEFDTELLWGEWRIEQPYTGPLGGLDISGWRETRLFFCKNGDCILTKPTRDIMLTEIFYDSPEKIEMKKQAIGNELRGKYKLPDKNEIYLHISKKPRSASAEIIFPFYRNHVRITQIPLQDSKRKYRLIMNYMEPSTYGVYQDGIIWKRCEKPGK